MTPRGINADEWAGVQANRQAYMDLMNKLDRHERTAVMLMSMAPQGVKPPDGMAVTPQGLVIHNRDKCDGRPCTFHNPSDHLMKDWPIHVRLDKMALAERICKHRVGHPDPDSLAWLSTVLDAENAKAMGSHGCCGCCFDAYEGTKD